MWAPYTPLSRRSLLCLLGAALSVLMSLLLPTFVPAGVMTGSAFYPIYALVGAQELLMFGVPGVLLFLRSEETQAQLHQQLAPRGPMETGLTMLTAVSYTLVGAIITALWSEFLGRFGLVPPETALPNPANAISYTFAIMCAAVIPAVSEELVFRGLLLNWLRRRGGTVAIVASAVVFALMHRSAHAFPALLVIGLFLGRLTIRHGGLFLPMVFHFVYNLSVVVLLAAGGAFTLPTVLLSTLIAFVSAHFLLKSNKEDVHGTDHHRL